MEKEEFKIESKRLCLRNLKMEDAEEIFKNWTNDKDVARYMRWEVHKSVNDTKAWLEEEIKNTKNGKNFCYGIILKETNELIGSIGAYLRPEEDNRCEIGYDIAKKYWGNGYTTEALKCLLEYLTNNKGIKKFICKHAKLNPASGAVMQKAGFRYIKDDFYESFNKDRLLESKVYYLDIDENIYKAKIEDSEEIAKIIKDGWNTAYKGLIDNNYLKNMNITDMTKKWEESIKQNKEIYVYKKDNKITGVICFGINEEKIGEVYVLYVKPEEKRKEIGTKLLNFAKQELLKQKYRELIVWCLKGNSEGFNFYKKNGGKFIGDKNYVLNGLSIVEDGFKFNLNGEKQEDEIILIKPTKEYEKHAIKYKQEYIDNGEKKIHASAKWDKIDSFEEWIDLLQKNSKKETVSKDWTVTSTFFGIRKSDGKIIGMIDIRHELVNDYLKTYAGNIGYSVLPSERRRGYATQMLNKGLFYCKDYLKLDKVMVNCHKENEGSRKTIVNAGGKLEKEYADENGEIIQIYWIYLK